LFFGISQSKIMAEFKGNGNISSRNGDRHHMIDRPLPQARESEEAVLGAILLNDDALKNVINDLHPKYFYVGAHQAIYKVMIYLFECKQPVNSTTVSEELNKSGKLKEIGGINYLTNLTNRATSSDNLDNHVQLISEKFINRGMIYLGNIINKEAYKSTTNGVELVDKIEQVYLSVGERKPDRSDISALAAYVMLLIEQMEKAFKYGE